MMGPLCRLHGLMFALPLLVLATACSSSSSGPTPTPTAVPTQSPVSPVTSVGHTVLPTPPAGSAFTATLVTDTNGLHDRSFNHLAWQGLQQSHARSGISQLVVQSASEAKYLPNLVRAAQHYSTLTVAVGYGMARAVYTAAKEFPQARFAIVDARPLDAYNHEVDLPNVENLLFKEQESGYLAGVLAGLMEKHHIGKATHGTIGYLGGQNIAAVNRYIAGYVAGAQATDPGIKILGDYAGSFADPKLGAQFGNRQIDGGADILFQVAAATGAGYEGAAQQRGVYGIGVDADQSYLGPFILTSAIKKVNTAITIAVRDVMSRRFRGGDRLLGAANGATGYARLAAIVPASIVARLKRTRQELASGAIVPTTTIPVH
jgi:basic membrane protein A